MMLWWFVFGLLVIVILKWLCSLISLDIVYGEE